MGDFTEILKGIFEKLEELFSQNLIDNQSPLYITKIQDIRQTANTLVAERCHRLSSDTKVVDLITGDIVLQRLRGECMFTIFWTKHDICITQKYVRIEVYT